MHVLITGAAGMLGRKLSQKVISDPLAFGWETSRLTLVDVIAPAVPVSAAAYARSQAMDLSQLGAADRLAGERPDIIFHLAAIVSGEAEADFDKGYSVNLDGTRLLFDAIRKEAGRANGYFPRLVFASSIAVYGAPFPEFIDDEFFAAPLTSYGTQKAICELMLSDYSRRRFFDGIGLRLPTICIRPGAPNKAASGFFSNILREPLIGQEAVLPVNKDVRHWFASPRSAIGFITHAAKLDLSVIGERRNLVMPGLSETVGGQIEALRRIAGSAAVKLIRFEPDQTIARIVAGWPSNFTARRAKGLGFMADASFDHIIRHHIEDELCG